MLCKCNNGFLGKITEDKIYEVLSIYNSYIYIILDDGTGSWEYVKNFDSFEGELEDIGIEFIINWNMI